MAKYEKEISLSPSVSIKVVFHGIPKRVFEDKKYNDDDIYFEAFESAGQLANQHYHGNISTTHTPKTNGNDKLMMTWGDVVVGSPYGWHRQHMQFSNGSISDMDLNNTYENLGGFWTPALVIYKNSGYVPQNIEYPSKIDLYNIAYFETLEDKNQFVTTYRMGTPNYDLIKNYGSDDTQEEYETSKQYWFYNSVTTYLKAPDGRYSIKQGTTYKKVNFEPTDQRLYFTGLDSVSSNYELKNYSGVECQYSTDGKNWTNAGTMPSGLAGIVKGNLKVGGAVLVGTFSTNIPIFGNNDKAQEYENGNIDVNEADNVDVLCKDDYSPVTPIIKAGDSETETTLGSGVAMDKMTMFYKLTGSQLANFGATLFNAENKDNIIAGTSLVGQDALNAIVGLRYYPFDVSKVCTTTGTYYIKLGSWDSGCASSGVITSNNGIIDMGNTLISPMFNNFLDYTNVGLSIYLPYIGTRSIDIKTVLNKTLSVKYAVDITTGKCKAMLFANGLLFDAHDGVIARDCPVSGADAQSYNTAIRQTNMAMTDANISGYGAIAGAVSSGVSIGTRGNPYNMVAGLGTAVTEAYSYAMSYNDRMAQATQDKVNARNNLPTYFNGSSGGQLGELEPQYVYLIFTINKTHMPANELEIVGKPSNNSGTISQFYGFLSCDMVKLESLCTNVEKTMIQNLLSNGIYI